MKRLSIATTAFGLLVAIAPARAGDVAQIIQSGNANVATIEQLATSGNNLAQVRQDQSLGTERNNEAHLAQHAVDNAVIDVHQSGFANTASVHQHDGANLQATVTSSGNTMGGHWVTIDQSGYGARAQVRQGGFAHSADIVQQGRGDVIVADITQSGDFHRATIFQAGSGLSATIAQGGNSFVPGPLPGNTATIRQSQ